MDIIHANAFAINMTGGEVHLRVRTLTPSLDNPGAHDVAKEVLVVMSPDAYNGFKTMLSDAERKEVS